MRQLVQAAEGVWPTTQALQSLICHTHIDLGVPWWSAIVGATVLLRVAALPIFIYQQKSMAKLAAISPKVSELCVRLDAEI